MMNCLIIVIAIFLPFLITAQTITSAIREITGVVTNDKNVPVSGAIITVKGVAISTAVTISVNLQLKFLRERIF